ncbi:hypothetical protein DENSPDRAFT_840566 [Dentipellis sp. KUC8613]|nr:hypothetical protein DENSPDRAFT_840566 [Dentipellis sp. KUC8613]
MLEYTIRLVRELTNAQVDEVVALSVRAFKDDPTTRILTGDNSDLVDPLFRSIVRAGELCGAIYLATNKSGSVLAVGLWFGPGQELWSTVEQRELGFNDLFARLSLDTQKWWTEVYGPRLAEFLRGCIGNKKRESWYANLIATDPHWQRHGIATALVEVVYQRAIADKTILALCTSNETNTVVYQRMGFEVKGRVDLPSPRGEIPTTCLTKTPSE